MQLLYRGCIDTIILYFPVFCNVVICLAFKYKLCVGLLVEAFFDKVLCLETRVDRAHCRVLVESA